MRTLSSRSSYVAAVAGALALTVGSTLTWAALERATFILTNGEKVSGTVVFHTAERTNIRADTRQFSLGTNDGKEVHFEFDHVAVIDFVAGTPANAELEALRPNSHTIVMRDGSSKRGLLVDLIGGDTVRWQREDGDRENHPIRNVRRIYLATESARSIFNYTPSATPTTSTASGRASAPPIPDGPGIVVRANTRWTDAGITYSWANRFGSRPRGRFSTASKNTRRRHRMATRGSGGLNTRCPTRPWEP